MDLPADELSCFAFEPFEPLVPFDPELAREAVFFVAMLNLYVVAF
jgi:hypothetical protein